MAAGTGKTITLFVPTKSLRKLAQEDRPGHVIIVLTDGRDVSSTASFGKAVSAVHRAGASIYPIGITGPDFTPDQLRELAQRTGGSYHQAWK